MLPHATCIHCVALVQSVAVLKALCPVLSDESAYDCFYWFSLLACPNPPRECPSASDAAGSSRRALQATAYEPFCQVCEVTCSLSSSVESTTPLVHYGDSEDVEPRRHDAHPDVENPSLNQLSRLSRTRSLCGPSIYCARGLCSQYRH